MKRFLLVVLVFIAAACGRKTPGPATGEAVGAELATFPQVLVLISSRTWAGMQEAAQHNIPDRMNANQYPAPYEHVPVKLDGRDVPVLVAYTGVWLAPQSAPLQPMSIQQYLRTFGADPGVDIASVVAPKGSIFFTREQLPDVITSARNAGAGAADLPYSVVRGSGR